MRLFPYIIARDNARRLDQQGPPSRVAVLAVMVPAAIVVIGFAALALIAIGTVLVDLI